MAVGLGTEERPVGTDDGGRGGRTGGGTVDGGEEAGVFGGTAEGGFFVEGVGWVSERGRLVSAGLGFVEVGVKNDVGAAAGGPTNGFRVTPAFVADGDAEGEGPGVEQLACGAGRIGGLFGGVELHLILEAGAGAIGIHDKGCDHKGLVDEALGAEDDRDAGVGGGRGDSRVGVFEEADIRGRNLLAGGAVAGNEALGEADDPGFPESGFGDRLLRRGDGLFGRCGVGEVGERDAEVAHRGMPILSPAAVK